MSFYQLSTGEKPSGDESANMENITLVPEGTVANAYIVKAELVDDPNQEKRYVINYHLIDGEYKGANVRQNIKAFDADTNKKDKAINMLVRLMKLVNYTPPHSMAPQTEDLQALVEKKLMVKVGQWDMDGKYGNFVRGLFAENEVPVVSGVLQEPKSQPPAPASQGYGAPNPNTPGHGLLDDDVPF